MLTQVEEFSSDGLKYRGGNVAIKCGGEPPHAKTVIACMFVYYWQNQHKRLVSLLSFLSEGSLKGSVNWSIVEGKKGRSHLAVITGQTRFDQVLSADRRVRSPRARLCVMSEDDSSVSALDPRARNTTAPLESKTDPQRRQQQRIITSQARSFDAQVTWNCVTDAPRWDEN